MVKNKSGFTLIELVVVISIVALMSASIYANYSAIDNRGKILSIAAKIKSDLNIAQNFSLQGQTNGQYRPNGWGVYFNRNLNKYIVFSDLDKSQTFDYPTKVLIHGSESVSANQFTDSSLSANLVDVQGGAIQVMGAGRPTDNTGYWQFDGTNDDLKISNNATFDVGLEEFAVDMWVNASSTGSKKAIFYRGDGMGTQSFAIYKDASDSVVSTIYDSGGSAYTITSTQTLTANTWYHVAVSRERNILKLFIDGKVQGSTQILTAVRSQSQPLYVGIEDDTSSSPWNGLIDEIRFSRGNGRWFERFDPPSISYNNNDETFKEVALPPGLVFERLYIDSVAYDELSVYFSPTGYIMYANGVEPTDSAKIKINNFGAEGTNSSADAPKILKILPSGLVAWSSN